MAALARAKKEDKRVLLQFGANCCGWCHKRHKLFDSDADIAAKLKEAYVVVLVGDQQAVATLSKATTTTRSRCSRS